MSDESSDESPACANCHEKDIALEHKEIELEELAEELATQAGQMEDVLRANVGWSEQYATQQSIIAALHVALKHIDGRVQEQADSLIAVKAANEAMVDELKASVIAVKAANEAMVDELKATKDELKATNVKLGRVCALGGAGWAGLAVAIWLANRSRS